MGIFDLFKQRNVAARPPGPAPAPWPEPLASAHTPALATRCLDQLALLFPEGFHRLEVRAHIEQGACRVDGFDAQPAAVPTSAPAFPDDPGLRTALFGDALARFLVSLGLPIEESLAFNVFASDTSLTVCGKAFEASGPRLHDAGFFRALEAALAGFQARQDAFGARFAALSAGGLRWDRGAGALAVTDHANVVRALEAHVLGSYAPSEQSWCWVWANSALANARQDAIGTARDTSNVQLLREPGFACTEPFSFAVAALAAHTIDPNLCIWRWPQQAHLFFAVRLDQG